MSDNKRNYDEETVDEYLQFHDDSKGSNLEKRNSEYKTMVNHYYDLVTDLYVWGWSNSFHFANQSKTETFHESILRHEYYLANQAGWKRDGERKLKLLDVGCGIGGPCRNLCRFTGCDITGITINQYQVDRATSLAEKEGLKGQATFVQGNFMDLPFKENSFDGAYEIEATCHSPDKVACFKQIYKVLKPGAWFVGYEWCMTDKFDPTNAEHLEIKKGIEEGDALPDIYSTHDVLKALREAGFEEVSGLDRCVEYKEGFDYPWYFYLTPGVFPGPSRVQFTPWGRFVAKKALAFGEWTGLVPKGTSGVSEFLNTAAKALVKGGELEIFTPMFFHMARKPLDG